MPIIDTIIPEITKQCIEPISEQIIYRLLDVMNLKNIFGNSIFLVSDDLQMSNFDDSENKKRTQNNRCDVKIIPNYNPLETIFEMADGRALDTHIQARRWTFSEYPVFSDHRANINLFEISVPCSVELQFSLKVKSVELADAVNMMLFSKNLAGGSVYDYNDIQFSYPFTDKFILLLYKMYKMQDDVLAKMSFQEYLSIGSNTAITVLTNRERPDESHELIIQRANTKVLGRMDYSSEKHETEDYNKVSNRYVIDFSYFFQFAKPALLRISYPIMIYNKMIEGQYVGEPKEMRYGEGPQYHPDRAINAYFYKHNKAQIDLDAAYPHVQYPYYDDWQRSPHMYADIMNKYQRLFTGLLSITVQPSGDLSLSVDLENEIFPLLNPDAVRELKYIAKEFNMDRDAFQTYQDIFRRLSIFDIAVFCNDAMVPFEFLQLSDDFVLTVTCPLHITKLYRIVISQIKDIRILNRMYVYYMLEHPEYYKDFLAHHMTYLEEHNFVRIISDVFSEAKDVVVQRHHLQTAYWDKLPQRAITINNFVLEIRRNRWNT